MPVCDPPSTLVKYSHDVGKHENRSENKVVRVQLKDFGVEHDLKVQQSCSGHHNDGNHGVKNILHRKIESVDGNQRENGKGKSDEEEQKEGNSPFREVNRNNQSEDEKSQVNNHLCG